MKLLHTIPVVMAGCCLTMGYAMRAPEMQQTERHEESQSASAASGSSNLSASDRRFLMKAASSGMMEIELGRLATEKGSTQGIKDFGQRMVDDHTKSNDRLKQIASEKNVTLPSDMDEKDRTEVERLSKLSGEQFDHAYLQHVTKDHKSGLAEFQKEAQAGSDPGIKAFANETIPSMTQHLDMAENQMHSGHRGMTGSASDTAEPSDRDKDKEQQDNDRQPPKQ